MFCTPPYVLHLLPMRPGTSFVSFDDGPIVFITYTTPVMSTDEGYGGHREFGLTIRQHPRKIPVLLASASNDADVGKL